MKLHRRFIAAVALCALLGANACSNNTQGDDASPVFLTVSFDNVTGTTNVASASFVQQPSVTLKSVIKVPGTGTTQFLDTRIDSYTVEWSRLDGGKTASPTETFAGNVIVPAGGTSTLTDYPFMTPGNLNRPPLDQLFPYNGGVDLETGSTTIAERATVTFRGHTLSGQPVGGSNSFGRYFYYSATAGRVLVSSYPADRVPTMRLQGR
jgi:hypothetical protein